MKRLFISILCLLPLAPAAAQTSPSLLPQVPVSGNLSVGGQDSWSFAGRDGSVLSFLVQADSDSLDPQFSITNSAGARLIGNDDYRYPEHRDALLEAITLPRDDIYTVTVSAVGGSAGGYTLVMEPGYSQTVTVEQFEGELTWRRFNNAMQVELADGSLQLTLGGASQVGTAVDLGVSYPADYYVQTSVEVTSSGAWTVGLTARQTGPNNYYLLALNEQGQWRFTVVDNGTVTILRDWTPHPAIVVGGTRFTLGMLVSSGGFDFFYDNRFFGRLDDFTLTEGSSIGLAVETDAAPNSRVSTRFDDLVVTTPLLIEGGRVLPQELLAQAPQNAAIELYRRGLIPAGGTMQLTAAESFVELARSGIERVTLARGSTFRDFALGTALTWQAASFGMTGCGLVFRSTSENDYTLAYLDQTGGYGISSRRGEGFSPGIFGERFLTDETPYHLLIIARDNSVYYYVNGIYSGVMANPPVSGEIGSAVINYDAISTSCRFTDTWLWSWD